MYEERLLKLAELLETVPVENFDLRDWRNDCGTTACACGWAALDPWFIKQGFVLIDDAPCWSGCVGWDAVEQFFDIGEETAERLFCSITYENRNLPSNDPLVVARRIREFVETGYVY